MILGHEAIVEVMEVGELVKDFKKGIKLLYLPSLQIGVPLILREDFLCTQESSWWMKFSNFKDSLALLNYSMLMKLMQNLAHLPEDIDPVAAVMLTDMTTTGFHAAELAEVKIGIQFVLSALVLLV